MPAIPKRKLYSKPKLVDLGSRKVSGWVDLTLKHSSSKTKVVVYERSLKHRQIEIVQHLVKLGLNVEAPLLDRNGNLIVIRQDKTTKTILTKNMGKTLDFFFHDKVKPNRRVALKIVSQLAEMLARIHEAGFCHYHFKDQNITWDGRKVGLIDFKIIEDYDLYFANRDFIYFYEVVDFLGLTRSDPEVQKAVKRLDEARPKK